MKVYVLIEADLPKGMDEEDFGSYAQDSVRACVGGYHPNDPVFQLDRKSVKGHYIQIAGQHDEQKLSDFQNLKSIKDGIRHVPNVSITTLSDEYYGE